MEKNGRVFGFLCMLASAACGADSAATISTGNNDSSPRRVARVDFSEVPKTLVVAGTLEIGVTIRDATGAPLTGRNIVWSTSDATVATVTATSANIATVTAKKRGSVTIGAKSEEAGTSAIISVTAAALQIRPESPHLEIGDSVQLSAQFLDIRGVVIPETPVVAWSVDNNSALSVSSKGMLHSLATFSTAASVLASVSATADGVTGKTSLTIEPINSGMPVSVRFVHAEADVGTLTLTTNQLNAVDLDYGDVRSIVAKSGSFKVFVRGFPATGQYPYMQDFTGALAVGSPLTLYAVGGARQGYLQAAWDTHAPVPAGKALIRIVMASEYAPSYLGNNLFVLAAGAPAEGLPLRCYFDLPNATEYVLREAGAMDIALIDAPGVVPSVSNVGTEYKRFKNLTALAGRATTFVIAGNDPASMRVLTVLDP